MPANDVLDQCAKEMARREAGRRKREFGNRPRQEESMEASASLTSRPNSHGFFMNEVAKQPADSPSYQPTHIRSKL